MYNTRFQKQIDASRRRIFGLAGLPGSLTETRLWEIEADERKKRQTATAETLTELIADSPDLMTAIREGEDDAAAGRFVTWEEVFGEEHDDPGH